MEIVQTYRLHSTEKFRFEYCWIESSDKNSVMEFLKKLQDGTRPNSAKIEFRDVDFILKYISQLKHDDDDLTAKLVIQKGNTDVSVDTRRLGGIWANLLFLIRVHESGNKKWVVYGGGKGRYKKYPLLEIEREKQLGFSYFISTNQNDRSKSKQFSAIEMIKYRSS